MKVYIVGDENHTKPAATTLKGMVKDLFSYKPVSKTDLIIKLLSSTEPHLVLLDKNHAMAYAKSLPVGPEKGWENFYPVFRVEVAFLDQNKKEMKDNFEIFKINSGDIQRIEEINFSIKSLKPITINNAPALKK